MKKPSVELTTLLDTESVGRHTIRKTMFGCPCYFLNGNMLSGVYEDTIFLRLSAEDREAIKAAWDEAHAFSPDGRVTMREYMALPEALVLQEPELRLWFDRALAYVRSLPPKVPKARSAASRTRKKP